MFPTCHGDDPRRPFQFSLGCLFHVMTVAAVVAWLWPRDLTPYGQKILGSWLALAACFWGAAISSAGTHHRQTGRYLMLDRRRRGGVFFLSLLAWVPPMACLVMFCHVFGNGGSHVAQLAGAEGMELHMAWALAWVPLFFTCPASVVVYLLTFSCYFRPWRDPRLLVMRLLGLANALWATWIVLRYAPDA